MAKKKLKERIFENEVVINDKNAVEFINPTVNGELKVCGTFPRDFARWPKGAGIFARPFDLPLVPESEIPGMIEKKNADKSWLSDIRNVSGPGGGPIPSTDQNGRGYCWCHSGVSANLLVRAVMHQPYADLSAYMIGCLIKNYRDEGGWGPEGLEFQAEHGVPDSKFWPQRSASRSNDNPAMRENAKLHRVEEWMDLPHSNVKIYLATCLLLNIPVVVDYNWWSHSVCAIDLVSWSPFKIRIWNSWGDSWSSNGTGILEGNKAVPDDAIAPRVIRAAA